ncbi:MAG: ABC transporter ATP-binding protein [Candidatus Nomurabacteria bacterium]|jgi:ABC-2 type transport system ATP-binding protein|nr:ABC transporter ATP-binding protein [Candidatus Nomurabacteria bacterium]
MKVELQIYNLTKRYNNFVALDNVSLSVNQGDIYGLIGRNGAGKTTFFKCVMGLAKITGGSVEIAGQKRHLDAARRQIGFMINPSFFPYLSAKQNLEYLARVKGVHAADEVDRLLKMVGLHGVKKPFKAFSLGMKQRLGIAGALLGQPSIVVLDEPINGLDPEGIADMRRVIKDTNQQHGTTFIISSHILSELDLVATRFGFLEAGVLIKDITHRDLHEHTKKSLLIEVNDPAKAKRLLKTKLNIAATNSNNQLFVKSHLDEPDKVAKILVDGGVKLYKLQHQETTLEGYFMQLIGGHHA